MKKYRVMLLCTLGIVTILGVYSFVRTPQIVARVILTHGYDDGYIEEYLYYDNRKFTVNVFQSEKDTHPEPRMDGEIKDWTREDAEFVNTERKILFSESRKMSIATYIKSLKHFGYIAKEEVIGMLLAEEYTQESIWFVEFNDKQKKINSQGALVMGLMIDIILNDDKNISIALDKVRNVLN